MSAAQQIGTPAQTLAECEAHVHATGDVVVPRARMWSEPQDAVFHVVAHGDGHVVVEALAGSGKTTTIVEAVTRTDADASVLVTAFNADIARELKRRLPADVTTSTLHSLGLKACSKSLGRQDIDKDNTVVPGLAKRFLGAEWRMREARTACCKIVALAKACLVAPDDTVALDELADAFDISIPKDVARHRVIDAASRILQEGLGAAGCGLLPFDDMIWLPVMLDLTLPRHDFNFVDETQDLNAAQLQMVIGCAGEAGRIVAVGDRRQAIYGFRGADRAAIPRMIHQLKATVLPLSITYRCATSIVAEAQRLVPHLQAAPGALDGIVRHTSAKEWQLQAQPGDFIISRTNAPLIRVCFALLKAGRRATIRGRDIGAGLAAFVRSTKAVDIAGLLRATRSWCDAEVGRLVALERDATAPANKADCIEALCEGAATVDDVLRKIELLFSEGAPGSQVLLTSTHKAKGLESDRVWLLRDTYCQWPGDEEENLLYVAITRAKRELVYVTEEEGE